ncbi:hypothetical protein [Myxococcus sp. RHSTA-1-4]|uniref:hypothetical protein n=1 Tax=Myxococcus sp. RHSTA-1-4 TaxID=2874601 RepID=UPI001CBCACBC|nr:hypothetical protein [Myxococcus sp. RHSTA-1-4]MBZ4417198.1 hypothetical protein [Myxococcus sp. RHSTA-1-4]
MSTKSHRTGRFSTYVRGIRIERGPAEVAGFLREVSNLPRWTRFFLHVGELQGHGYAVETLMGPATTWIHEYQSEDTHQLEIVSIIRGARETATLDLYAQGEGTMVRFHLRLPSKWDAQRVTRQLGQLDDELRTLKRLVESHQPSAQPRLAGVR